ncbi:MAG TPA: transcription antitermination factor NusB, partial [Thermogutta sp.]|nr:transcription antitermination factor NusB [Thermogutta sp.]
DTPPRVVIDEAVELAKLFGSQQSGPFVNGILDRLYRDIMAQRGTSVE